MSQSEMLGSEHSHAGTVLPRAPRYEYSTVTGFFRHSEEMKKEDAKQYNPMTKSLGPKTETDTAWVELMKWVDESNRTSGDFEKYMVLELVRHGKGYHNEAVSRYGKQDYIANKGSIHGDDSITWGPDASLTEEGEHQVEKTRQILDEAYDVGAPRPRICKVSPLQRAMQTANIIHRGSQGVNIEVRENLREKKGVYPAESRSPKSMILKRILAYKEEAGGSSAEWEVDPTMQETDTSSKTEREDWTDVLRRMRTELDHLATTCSDSVAMIVYHGYMLSATFETIRHPKIRLEEACVLPVVVKMSVPEDFCLLRNPVTSRRQGSAQMLDELSETSVSIADGTSSKLSDAELCSLYCTAV